MQVREGKKRMGIGKVKIKFMGLSMVVCRKFRGKDIFVLTFAKELSGLDMIQIEHRNFSSITILII